MVRNPLVTSVPYATSDDADKRPPSASIDSHTPIWPELGRQESVDLQPWTSVLNKGDDDEFTLTGYSIVSWRYYLSWICILLTCGLLRLLFYWKPELWIYAIAYKCPLAHSNLVIIRTANHQLETRDIVNVELNKPNTYYGPQQEGAKFPLGSTPNGSSSPKPTASRQHSATISHPMPSHGTKPTPTTSSSTIPTVCSFSLPLPGAQFLTVTSYRYFTFKKLVYAWSPASGTFSRCPALDSEVPCALYHQLGAAPLSAAEAARRWVVFGPNLIRVRIQPIVLLLFREVINPFYVFQIASVIIWYNDEYHWYASVIVIISVLSISADVYQVRKNQLNLRNMIQTTDVSSVVRPKEPDNDIASDSSGYDAMSKSAEVENDVNNNERGNIYRFSSVNSGVSTGGPKSADYDVITIESSMLVPGDVIIIPPHGCTMQCDAVLLEGNCIVNESMLTGESVPVTKIPLLKDPNQVYSAKEHGRHTLFCGTRVLQTRYYGGTHARAVVIRTGFYTTKGALVRSIMYPKPVDHAFMRDLLRMIVVLAFIAGIGFVYAIVVMNSRGSSAHHIAVRSLDIITIVVPPALPFAMTVGIIFAQQRLRRANIFCIAPSVINSCGSVSVVVFDKTGTLTEDGLDFQSILPVVERGRGNKSQQINSELERGPGDVGVMRDFYFDIENQSLDKRPIDDALLHCMASCNSLTVVDGEVIGDPLDLILLNATGWQFEEPAVEESSKFDSLMPTVVRAPAPHDNIQIGILRQFPFSSSLQRMSVLTRAIQGPESDTVDGSGDAKIALGGEITLFAKGAPEMIKSLCDPQTIPLDFAAALNVVTTHGYRVIGFAQRKLPHLSYLKAQKASRDSLEKDMTFLGLAILENRLKPQTTSAISALSAARIRSIMATGDNILTAVSVARECGILDPNKATYSIDHEFRPTLDNSDSAEMQCFFRVSDISAGAADVNTYRSTTRRLAPQPAPCPITNGAGGSSVGTYFRRTRNDSGIIDIEAGLGSPADVSYTDMNVLMNGLNDATDSGCDTAFAPLWPSYQLALTGPTLSALIDHAPSDTILKSVISSAAVYARMSPDQKASLIGALQAEDHIVAMCGDGANDCGALKAAHAGISLSDAEASIASPFTSANPDIQCVISVIREGRASLVTSFGIFKYMAAYSLTQFLTVSCLYSLATNLADFQFLYIDLFLITLLVLVFGYTDPAVKLHYVPPPSKILTPSTVISLFFQIAGTGVVQVLLFCVVPLQPWFTPFVQTPAEDSVDSYQVTALFCVSSFQYIALAIVNSKAAPHRRSILTNRYLTAVVVLTTVVSVIVTMYPPGFIANFLELKLALDIKFRGLILLLAAVHVTVALVVEWYIVDWFVADYLPRRKDQRSIPTKQLGNVSSDADGSITATRSPTGLCGWLLNILDSTKRPQHEMILDSLVHSTNAWLFDSLNTAHDFTGTEKEDANGEQHSRETTSLVVNRGKVVHGKQSTSCSIGNKNLVI